MIKNNLDESKRREREDALARAVIQALGGAEQIRMSKKKKGMDDVFKEAPLDIRRMLAGLEVK